MKITVNIPSVTPRLQMLNEKESITVEVPEYITGFGYRIDLETEKVIFTLIRMVDTTDGGYLEFKEDYPSSLHSIRSFDVEVILKDMCRKLNDRNLCRRAKKEGKQFLVKHIYEKAKQSGIRKGAGNSKGV